MGIVFVGRNGSLAGKRLEFNEPLITLGRRPTNMVRFTKEQEPGVSNLHCEVFQQGGTYYVRDMASANGTFVDGIPVKDPVPLRDGSVILLGNAGPELVVSLPYEEALTMRLGPGELGALGLSQGPATGQAPPPAPPGPVQAMPPPVVPPPPPLEAAFPRPMPAAFSEPLPQHKDGIGMPTLMATLDKAKAEVRSEYSSRMVKVYVACGAILVVAIAAIVFVKVSGDRRLQEVQAEWEKSKEDAEKRYNEIKNNAAASTQHKIEQLQKLLDEKTRAIEKMAADAKSAGVSSEAIAREMKRNREAMSAIQAQMSDLTAFVNFKERYSKCVYSLVLKFTEGGETKYSFVGSAFCLSTSLGLLGTSARVVESIKPLLKDGKFQLVARCNGDAQYCYGVAMAYPHPEFKAGEPGIGKDVAILKLDLRRLKEDGTLDTELPLPAALQPAGEDELDQVVSGVNVAVFGFSEQDRARLESAVPVTGLATLSTNIVDGTFAFSGEPVSGRRYGVLRHNCMVPKGFAGAPVVNTKNRVVGIQSNTVAPGAARAGAAANATSAVSIKVLEELQTQFLKRLAEGQ